MQGKACGEETFWEFFLLETNAAQEKNHVADGLRPCQSGLCENGF